MRIISLLIPVLSVFSCHKDNVQDPFTKQMVDVGTHKLATYSIEKNSSFIVVLESGLGDDHSVWDAKKVAESIGQNITVVTYDRGGYGASGSVSNARTVHQLATELSAVVDHYSKGRKVLLVGHSVGGLIIRDYAISHPTNTAALLFVDPSHEYYNQPTQEIEDIVFNALKSEFGANSGPALEARQLIEDFAYTSSLPSLPNVPVAVLTSMKQDDANNTSDATYHKTRQDWFDAHEKLKAGVTDFTHIATTTSGHNIMKEQPELVLGNVEMLKGKIH